MDNAVRKVMSAAKKMELQHPEGLQLAIKAGTFPRDYELEAEKEDRGNLLYGHSFFKLTCTETSTKKSVVSMRLDYKPGNANEWKSVLPFVEIRGKQQTVLVAGRLVEKTVGDAKEYFVVAECEPFRKDLDVVIGSGCFFFPAKIQRVFHPVQHQFKIAESQMEVDALGNSRRRTGEGGPCERPSLPQLYPACYPAAWAALFNCYCMTPAHPRRKWEVGTPTETNPPPDEYGDSFSTWVMGSNAPGDDPVASRVEDWQAEPSDPTPVMVEMENPLVFEATADADELDARAEAIKRTLLWEVGGHSRVLGKIRMGRPVRMEHNGHAWLIVGIDTDGYWDHALATDAWSFSNYCLWENAPWKTDGREHRIKYPSAGNTLRPENKRLGCINFEGSGDRMKRIRFWDAYVYSGSPARTINWTPHTRTEAGYIWTYEAEPLNCEGYPEGGLANQVGNPVPRPVYDHGSCAVCGNNADGCCKCRTRLLLPFWVHNTTLDELVAYRLQLHFFNSDRRWVGITPKPVPKSRGETDAGDLYLGFHGGRWNTYSLPGPLPDTRFSIQARMDPNTGEPRGDPWNSQGVGWYIDFHRGHFPVDGLYGIRLILSCVERSGEPVCMVQDKKQLWFSVANPAPF